MNRNAFKDQLASLLNRHSAENASNTPDFILADYLCRCLDVWNASVQEREEWWGRHVSAPSTAPTLDDPPPQEGDV
jgi:hypothetical protein